MSGFQKLDDEAKDVVEEEKEKEEGEKKKREMPGSSHKCVICGKTGPLGMECSRCGEDSGGRYL